MVFLDLPNHVGVFELTQPKGEHPRCEAWNGTEETVEPVGPLPPDIPEDEKAPFPTEDSQARRDGAVLERDRSEEHTSELQSLAYLVCRLLLEKKKKKIEH